MSNDVTITVRVNDQTARGFRDVNGRLRDMNGRFAAAAADMQRSAGGLTASLGEAGTGFGALKGHAIGAAAAIGVSLLPTIGALAPMLTGLAVVGGGAALAMDDLKKKAKELKPAFEDWKKVAEKAVAPHTEKAVRSLKGAMKDLTPVIETGADTFGRITEKAARFADSPAFKGALAKNAEMGSKWVEEFAGSLGTFTQAFLDFGAKSQPALDAWDKLLGGFLDTGLPKMFDGLEQGIGGSSELLGGMASFINDGLLPALGKVAGSFSEAFGPLIGEALEATGAGLNNLGTMFEGLMELAEPFAGIMADGFRAMNDVAAIGTEVLGELASVVGGALFEGLMAVVGIDTSQLGNGFRGFSDWVHENEGAIRNAFVSIASGIVDMVTIGVNSLPMLVGGFRLATEGVLTAVDGLVSGLAVGLGHLPGGEIFKQANEAFDDFATGFRESLRTAQEKANEFATTTTENLSKGQLKLNISSWESQLKTAKEQLKTVPPEKRSALKALIKDLQEKVRQARADLASLQDRTVTVTTHYRITGSPGAQSARRSGSHGSQLAYANGGRVRGYADGGPLQHFPNGGYVEGPGGPRSDSILASFGSGAMAAVSDTEYVVQSSAVKKYGVPLLDALNRGTLKIAGLARGGVTKAEAQARRDARGDLTISHFGRMAGHQRSEFRSELGNPDSMRSLIDNLNQWRTQIMKATHGGTERSLLKALDSTGRKLLSYEKQLTSVTKSLEGARDKLNSLKQAASQLADSVKSGVLNSANITKRQGDGPVTVASIMGGLTASRDKATSFSKALADLQKKGLSSTLLQQIAEAGIDGGGLETAGALLGASSSEIKSMNSLQTQIGSAATSAGKTTADAVFGGAIKAQTAVVKLLTGQQQRLSKSMDKLAATMEKAIEKGFGMKAAGGIVGAASGGARGSWTMVGEHAPELVRLPFGSRVYSGPDTRRMMQEGAWASMLNTPRSGGARYTPMPGGQQEVKVVLDVRTGDRNLFAEYLVGVLQKEIANRGGNVQAALGQSR
ncbi:hypothetical protein ACFWJ5_02480 [Streptomyces qaidamensis]|uniref:hypothetical protein n=1 Tax=Streptomyces qaidamensis TaxID=1783515 RepID=UPI0036543B86